ncbi:MAG: electron transfer flavoprotein [Candidatus Scatomorpha sp.]|jgi:electron transfer flavoprotein beta subunit
MKIVACYKLVPDDAQISFRHDGTPDLGACEWQIGQYDLCAVEAAAQMAEKNEGVELIALTAGGDIVENSKLRKSILSRGPQEMVAVKDEKLATADSYAVASTLAAAIRGLGDVSVAFFGEGSGDVYAQQVGNITGAILGWNTVNAVSKVELDGDELVVERNLEDCVETLRVPLPAAVTVTSDICLPRLATMKEILKAGKKPCAIKSLEETGADCSVKVETVSLKAKGRAARDCKIVAADDEGLALLAAQIRKKI